MNSSIRPITPRETCPLRHEILRPNQPISETVYPLDDDRDTYHVGAFLDENLVGVASIYHEDRKGKLGAGSWRIRGMAVKQALQGKGIGSRLLSACVAHAREKTAHEVWCNGRITAARFYQNAGFKPVGNQFEITGIGPHYVFVYTV